MQRLLTPAEAAELLAISPKHLRWLTDASQVPWVNIGLDGRRPTRRYRQEDVLQFIVRRSRNACQYIENTANQNITTTSSFTVVDFQAPRARATSGRRNAS
ncbi:DNA-binding protein [Mesorhizobium sp. M7A.F.Ca.US.011.01.1.1]|uniref:helix-turn-helix domain-containing protein n=1 Tax=Mesorhizobium sp. M7A.F.Ca.US.011.01.1.1 TaxID=2496741 RepID=UPI000FCC6EEF|nr:helix-turn-helix domain-containing protein [Mesorhizobium sp. M7A.F.Ca.US.011.01.1.1]RUX32596.1 DNA-binding protein [Mesorhizobium sp. M7A.F.Ca.US.011.01.1.1]